MFFRVLLISLICCLCPGVSLRAAERLEVQLEDMTLPISVNDLAIWADGLSIPESINELSDWINTSQAKDSEISEWLNLLELENKALLVKILKAPLIKDRSMAREILRSWAGRELLDGVSSFIKLDNDETGLKVFNTFESLLQNQSEVTALDLLQSISAKTIQIDLNALLKIATIWREELIKQRNLVFKIRKIASKETIRVTNLLDKYKSNSSISFKQKLEVSHRSIPLRLDIWRPIENSKSKNAWIILMPGLGGSQDHFSWLAKRLSRNGWAVVLIEHPGSDSRAIEELLEGKSPLPGVEVLPDRLSDLYAVLNAKNNGTFDIKAEEVVLMGHSLGALTAFLAAGAAPEIGLISRCEKALENLSLTNLSQLVQCQMTNIELVERKKVKELKAIVAINSFGSLLWPSPKSANIRVPVLLTGGTNDLITPAISEQLRLMLSTYPNPLSRTLLIEEASHFSPIRVEGQLNQQDGEDLFQLGEAFVGIKPLKVQSLLGSEIIRFLKQLELGKSLESEINIKKDEIRFHVLDRSIINSLFEI
mgnify:CR=1 FL=1